MPTDREVWNNDEWVQRRSNCREYRRRYEGENLEKREPTRNPRTGKQIERYPLKLNADKLACDIHRDIARGMSPNDEPLFVQASVSRKNSPERAELVENVVNELVWEPSHGGAIQQEGLLSMNVYGEAVYKLQWEPWHIDLPLGLGVRLIRDPSLIKPVFDFLDPWRLEECYFGYEIDPGVASRRYGVQPQPEDGKSLYMEYWTKESYYIHVDGQVPSMKIGDEERPLAGKNPWGIVPFYYIPHERTTALLGDSEIEETGSLVEELNASAIAISDLATSIKSRVFIGTDIRSEPKFKQIQYEGGVFVNWIDLGPTQTIANAKTPTLASLPIPDVPEGVIEWPRALLEFWMMFQRISPAAFGLDDTRSGRITGPAVVQRMWTSTAHASTERTNYTTIKNLIDSDIVRILATEAAKADLELVGKDDPGLAEEDVKLRISQVWLPKMPLDQQEHYKQLIEMYRELAISPTRFFKEFSVQDIDGEKKEIEEWGTTLSEVKAASRPPMFGGGDGSRTNAQTERVQRGDRTPPGR